MPLAGENGAGALNAKAAGDTTNGLKVQQMADSTTTGTITANGQTVTVAMTSGQRGFGGSFSGTYAGLTVIFEASYDGGTTYLAVLSASATSSAGAASPSQSPGTNGAVSYIGEVPPGATHMRARATAYTSGTANVVLAVGTVQPVAISSGLSIASIIPGNSASALGKAEDAVAATGDVGVFALGVRNDTQATSTNADGDYIQQSHDARGAIRVNPASFTYSHIATATTTTVKSGAGDLHSITVNSKGTVASTITVYDNTAGSGTVIAVIDSLNLGGAFVFDIAFATGLTLVTTGTVAPDVTVSYR